MRIYTRTGDKGRTGLYGGKRVSKASTRVAAYGEVDELNAYIGLCQSHLHDQELTTLLRKVQSDLMVMGSDLAAPANLGSRKPTPRITPRYVTFLERQIDRAQARLPQLRQFILPTGTPAAAHLHVARAVCRRAERAVAALMTKQEINPQTLAYLNRLSDLLFVLARLVNRNEGFPEERWAFQEPRRAKGSTPNLQHRLEDTKK